MAERLRDAGHDVVRVSDRDPHLGDREVLEMAGRGRRILLTHDKDFGELVFLRRQMVTGVILLRLFTGNPSEVAEIVVALVSRLGTRLEGAFTTVTDGRVRLRKIE